MLMRTEGGPRPSKVMYDIGQDKHGRRLELRLEGEDWTLWRGAANQRDDEQAIGLNLNHLRTMVAIVRGADL
jgi:hypothetical protein